MRLWILFGGGVLILAGAIWPFARRTEKLAPVPVAPAVAARHATPEPPKPEPAKIVEVIDLARAYEPVREPEEPAGTVNPASFIEVPEAPKPIPPAAEFIDVMPREVDAQQRLTQLLNQSDDLRQAREQWHRYWMNNQPSVLTYERVGVRAPIERLKVMPREAGRVKQEEQERQTDFRDDFVRP